MRVNPGWFLWALLVIGAPLFLVLVNLIKEKGVQ